MNLFFSKPAPGRICVVVALLGLLACGYAQAAAEWEWTRGQGWSEGAGSPRQTAAEQIKYAYDLEKKGEYYDACKQYFLLLETFPATPEAGVALQRLAECLFKLENYYQSFQAIEEVIKSYPQSRAMQDLLQMEMGIGNTLQTEKKGGILASGQEGRNRALSQAVEIYKAVIRHDPYGPFADDALLKAGDCYLALGQGKEARSQFSRLLDEFENSSLADQARLGLTRCDVLEGKAESGKVRNIINEMRTKEPGEGEQQQDTDMGAVEDSLNELEEMEAKKMWDSAQYYLNRGTHESVSAAQFSLTELVRRYPSTTWAAKTRKLLPGIVIPAEDKSRFRIPKINLNLNPFKKKDNTPPFVTPQIDKGSVTRQPVDVPVPGVHIEIGRASCRKECRSRWSPYH